MKTITIKDIPPSIHKALKQQAKLGNRSLNREILELRSSAVMPKKIQVEEFLADVRQYRKSLPGKLTDTLLEEASRSGRP